MIYSKFLFFTFHVSLWGRGVGCWSCTTYNISSYSLYFGCFCEMARHSLTNLYISCAFVGLHDTFQTLWRWHDIFQAISCEAGMTVLSILYIFMFFLCGQAWHFLYILCVFLVNKHGICVFLMFCVSFLWTIMTALSILYISYLFIMELAW